MYIFTVTPKCSLDDTEFKEFQDELDKSVNLIADLLNDKEDISVTLEDKNRIKISLLAPSNLDFLPITMEECKKELKKGLVFSALYALFEIKVTPSIE